MYTLKVISFVLGAAVTVTACLQPAPSPSPVPAAPCVASVEGSTSQWDARLGRYVFDEATFPDVFPEGTRLASEDEFEAITVRLSPGCISRYSINVNSGPIYLYQAYTGTSSYNAQASYYSSLTRRNSVPTPDGGSTTVFEYRVRGPRLDINNLWMAQMLHFRVQSAIDIKLFYHKGVKGDTTFSQGSYPWSTQYPLEW